MRGLITKTTALVLATTASVFAPTTAFATFIDDPPAGMPLINCLWGTLWNPETLRLCEDNIAPHDVSSSAILSPLQPLIEMLNETQDVTVSSSNEQFDIDANLIDQLLELRERITDRMLDAAKEAAEADLT
jgi:hypothetical protein